MQENKIVVDPYRWVVLFVFALISAIIQIQWLTFASIAREARLFYQVSALQIDLLSLIFMGVFLVVCIPASYIIDTFGIRIGLGIGAVLTGIFGLMKGVFPHDYTLVVIAQTGLAVAQPFILNAATKVAVQWFPLLERALAVGIATLAQFAGIIIVMVFTPLMIGTNIVGVYDLATMLMTYGLISCAGAVILLVFLKERPFFPSEHIKEKKHPGLVKSIGQIFSQRDMAYLFPLFFIGLGMFNAISTCIDQICQTKGLSIQQTGIVGGIMLVAGIIGAVILPVLSDRQKKRRKFICMAMAGATPGIMGLAFFNDYALLLISSFILGFFLLGGGAPVGFQYCAEVTRPAPESISQGLLLFTGQISGILFIVLMNTAGMKVSLVIFIGLALINIVLSLGLKESKMILASRLTDVKKM
ncbi:MAG: MFS transporter [Proteobacteria bacterium]|nr:MFS transporter [Desulfobacula sp.]MBU3951844.1 MFS transporter [Pseudomonadota bacterium]MBU4130684.1 MFS transporter [Pseudomonadota bacterium]